MINFYKQQSGAAMLVMVVIFTVIFLLTIKGVSFLGVSNIDISRILYKGNNLLAFSDGCAEEALRQIQINPSYTTSSLSLSIAEESCIINIGDILGKKVITVVSNSDNYYKKIKMTVSVVSGEISIDSWEELSE